MRFLIKLLLYFARARRMLCPNCGSESKPDRRFCFNCGRSFLSARAARSMSASAGATPDIGTITISNMPLATGELRFPDEMVFVPSFDEEPIKPVTPAPARPDIVFEDEEADDEFEQSLSGLRVDEIEEAVDVDAVRADVAETSASKADVITEVAISPPETGNESLNQAVAIEDVAETAPEIVVNQPRISRSKGVLKFAATILFGIAAFGAGAFATMWTFELPPRVPHVTELSVVSPDSFPASPPVGMAYISGGEFQMGSDIGDEFSKPAHAVTVEPFFIDITEVTNEAYGEFVKATAHDAPLTWANGVLPAGQEKFPVTGVTWYDAAEYAAWRGKRLPTEAEWEFAARGKDGRVYPWGDGWDTASANLASARGGARAVGSGSTSAYGLFDMAGNVWEWTSSNATSYPNGKQIPWSRFPLKIIRGGSWQSDSRSASSAFRGFYGASGEKDYTNTGFRCVKDLPKK